VERRWWTLLASCIAIFMLLLDVTIVNVALPSIERDLGADFSDLQWVIDAYALTLAGLLLAAGSLADKVGRRLVFMLGLAIFTASSLACGLAPDPLFLDVSRAAQYYGRFGFRPAVELGVMPPEPRWGSAFQARPLRAYTPSVAGPFEYAPAFSS